MTDPYAPPRELGAIPRALVRLGPNSFLRIYGLSLVGAAAGWGCLATMQHMFTSGALFRAHASQFVLHDGLRRTAPLAHAVALALSLAIWAGRQRPERLPRRRGRVLKQALVAALPGYAVSSGIAIVVGLATLLG